VQLLGLPEGLLIKPPAAALEGQQGRRPLFWESPEAMERLLSLLPADGQPHQLPLTPGAPAGAADAAAAPVRALMPPREPPALVDQQ